MNQGLEQMRRLAVLVVGLALTSCGQRKQPTPAPESGKKILIMHYMPWYTTPAVSGQWGGHWTGWQSQHHPDQTTTNGLPDIWSHYHPLIGLYDSADPDALECHLLQMKLAGIDGVLADWYGISETADYPIIHKATRALFDASERFGMKFAVCYEDRTVQTMVGANKLQPDQITNHLAQTMQWLQKEWFTKPQYLQFNGRPLLLNFGPIYLTDRDVWDAAFKTIPNRPSFYALHHLWKKAGGDGGFTWIHHDPWQGTPTEETIRTRIHEVFTYFSTNRNEVIVSAYPGFNDVYEQHLQSLDYRGGKTLQETLEVGMKGPWPLIQLVTWNDYGEGTMIEPTHEFGYSFLEIIQQTRRKELGQVFTFTAEDLRLPSRLYALRKKGSVPAAELDRISQLLNKGACSEARRLLDAQERT
jgi:Glycosyl hydrolase family 99